MTRVRSIAVLRALDLGDMLCAVPALRALRHGYSDARISLVGLPWAAAFAGRMHHLVDDFFEFPGHPALPERPADPAGGEQFLEQMRARRFDLAIQLHGSGEVTNRIVAEWRPRALAGLSRHDPPPGQFAPWVEHLHEVEQCLRVIDALGLPRRGEHLEFRRTDGDAQEFDELAAAFPALGRPYAVVHGGAKWPSRRWPAWKFAAVAAALRADGLEVVLTGVASEATVTSEIASVAGAPVHDLAGRTSLGSFAEVLRHAALVVTNDTGASHVAVAVGTPSVVVSCGSDVARWAPLERARHITLAVDAPCRPCTFAHCPYGHECSATTVDQVLVAARRLLDGSADVAALASRLHC